MVVVVMLVIFVVITEGVVVVVSIAVVLLGAATVETGIMVGTFQQQSRHVNREEQILRNKT